MPRYNPKQELEKRLAELQGSQAEARSPFDRGAAVLRGMDIGKHFEDIAREALTISDDNHSIKAAFARSGLDSRNPFHWKILVEMLADVLFPPPARRGAPQKWSPDRYRQLLAAVDAIRSEKPGAPTTDLCKFLSKKAGPFEGVDPKNLRRRLYDASTLFPDWPHDRSIAQRRVRKDDPYAQGFPLDPRLPLDWPLPESLFSPLILDILSSIGGRIRARKIRPTK